MKCTVVMFKKRWEWLGDNVWVAVLCTYLFCQLLSYIDLDCCNSVTFISERMVHTECQPSHNRMSCRRSLSVVFCLWLKHHQTPASVVVAETSWFIYVHILGRHFNNIWARGQIPVMMVIMNVRQQLSTTLHLLLSLPWMQHRYCVCLCLANVLKRESTVSKKSVTLSDF